MRGPPKTRPPESERLPGGKHDPKLDSATDESSTVKSSISQAEQAASPAEESADFLTVLECVPGQRAAKLYTDVSQPPSAYDAGFLYTPIEVPVSSLDDIAAALEALRQDARCHIIRGKLKPDWPAGLVARRKRDHGDKLGAPFEEAEHWYFSIDADKSTTPFDADDRVGCVEAWRATLPPGLREAALVFQFSASQHLSPTVRGHATFWLDEPLGGATLKLWAERHGFDSTVYGAVSVLYTADPLFAEGLEDPIHPRELVRLPGGVASLDLTEAERCAVAGVSTATKIGTVQVGEVGDPSPEPDAVKARARVARQLESAFAAPDGTGRRWKLCGAVGGAFAKLAIPPEECCAVLEDLRAGDLADHDFHAGLNWALGAYGLKDVSKALGMKEIDALLGGTTAGRFRDELSRLAEATAPAEEVAPPAAAITTTPETRWAGTFVPWDLEIDAPPIHWVIPGLEFGPGRTCMTVGFGGDGKTAICQQKAFDIALGRKVFGRFDVRQGKVLHIDYEAGGAHGGIVLENYARLCRGHDVDRRELKQVLTVGRGEMMLTDDKAYDWLCWMTDGFAYCLIDALVAALPGVRENDADEIKQPLYMLEKVSATTGVTFDTVHHENKPANGKPAEARYAIRGSTAIHGALSAAMTIRPVEGEINMREVSCAKKPRYGFIPFGVRFVDVKTPNPKVDKGWLAGGQAAGVASWGVRIEHAPLEPAGAKAGGADTHYAVVIKNANAIEAALRGSGVTSEAYKVGELRSLVKLSGDDWNDAIAECRRRCSVSQESGARTSILLRFVPEGQRPKTAVTEQRARAFDGRGLGKGRA